MFRAIKGPGWVISRINYRINRFRSLPILPGVITFAITYKCNSKCVMCKIWDIYGKNPSLVKRELTISEIQEFFSDSHFFKSLGFVQLTGGEPFLRKDLVDIVQSIHDCKKDCTIYIATNGFLTKQILTSVEEILSFHQNLIVGVSLDGIGNTHDKMRGAKGSFRKTTSTLDLLHKNFPDLPLQITMTVAPINFRDILQVYEYAKDRALLRINVVNKAKFYQNLEEQYIFSEADIEWMESSFRRIGKKINSQKGKTASILESLWLKGNIEYIRNKNKRLIPCSASFTRFFLDPYGEVYPCLIFNEKMGNIREKRIKDIWFSERASIIRRKIKQNKCPNCWIAHETFGSMWDHFDIPKYILENIKFYKNSRKDKS